MDKNSYSLLSKKHNENEISLSFKTKPENSQTQCPLVSMNHNENSSITTDTPSDMGYCWSRQVQKSLSILYKKW